MRGGVRGGVCGGEGVKRRPPHLGAIGAFLPAERMFVDGSVRDRTGTGRGRSRREGLGGWLAPAETQTGAGGGSLLWPSGREGPGEAFA